MEWYRQCKFPETLCDKISEAKNELRNRRVELTPGNIVAELSFGFWTSLFNRATIINLSKPLMRVFYFCPKSMRQPDNIRTRLNKGRDLRNRCFHHEPLLWQPLYELHRDVSEVIKWIEPGLHAWIKIHDRVPATLGDWIKWRDSPEPAHAESVLSATNEQRVSKGISKSACPAANPAQVTGQRQD